MPDDIEHPHTMEGKFVRAAYNNEGYVILGYQAGAAAGHRDQAGQDQGRRCARVFPKTPSGACDTTGFFPSGSHCAENVHAAAMQFRHQRDTRSARVRRP